ncbi:MAG: hypothetical protein Q8Q09_00295 [Deltaproteobacteria bacterium]|nr:hypothetical protein [Deltaproteobacteria bacterium]
MKPYDPRFHDSLGQALPVAEPNEAGNQAVKAHEQAQSVRLSGASPTASVWFPQERWLAVFKFIPAMFVLNLLYMTGLPLESGEPWSDSVMMRIALILLTSVLLSLWGFQHLVQRTSVVLDAKGVHNHNRTLISKTISLGEITGFSVRQRRRMLDNLELWDVVANLRSGKTEKLGSVRDADEAQEMVEELSATLMACNMWSTNYRVAG